MIWGDARANWRVTAPARHDHPGRRFAWRVAGSTYGARFLNVGVSPFTRPRFRQHAERGAHDRPKAADGNSVTLDASVSSGDAVDNGVITAGVNVAAPCRARGSLSRWSSGLGRRRHVCFADLRLEPHGLPDVRAKVFSNVAPRREILHRGTMRATSAAWPAQLVHLPPLAAPRVHRLSQADRRYTGDMLMRPDVGIKGAARRTNFRSMHRHEKERMARMAIFTPSTTTS